MVYNARNAQRLSPLLCPHPRSPRVVAPRPRSRSPMTHQARAGCRYNLMRYYSREQLGQNLTERSISPAKPAFVFVLVA